jgi:DNA-directed primase/polymerase protein
MEASNRCFYEVIPENQPCHLYFDLEFSFQYPSNSSLSKQKIESYFEQLLCFAIPLMLGKPCSQSNILRLDATSSKKFSQHWVVKLPGSMFENNIQCGYCVRMLVDHLERQVPFVPGGSLSIPMTFEGEERTVPLSELCDLFQRQSDPEGGRSWFIDLGVYTRNRNFRIYGSSKRLGVSPALYLASSCTYPLHSNTGDYHLLRSRTVLSQKVFLESLVSYRGHLYKGGAPIDPSQLITVATTPRESPTPPSSSTVVRYSLQHELSSKEFPFQEVHLKELDALVASWLFARPGRQGQVRGRLFFSTPPRIQYSIASNRFCGNIGREHKSNHVFVTADLQQGHLFQQCLDPSCKGYRSEPMIIPEGLIASMQMDLQEEELEHAIRDSIEGGDPIWAL